jgi:flagellin-like hook-associated protein FlgL
MKAVNVYPKAEQLEKIVQGLNKSLVHIQYLLANYHDSFIDQSSLRALQAEIQAQIDELKSLYDS